MAKYQAYIERREAKENRHKLGANLRQHPTATEQRQPSFPPYNAKSPTTRKKHFHATESENGNSVQFCLCAFLKQLVQKLER